MGDMAPWLEMLYGALYLAIQLGALIAAYILSERSRALRGPLDRRRAHRPARRHDGRAKLLGRN